MNATLNEVPTEHRLGDCLEAAFNMLRKLHTAGEADNWRLIHTMISGDVGSPVEGWRFMHAFLVRTDGTFILDCSNGRQIVMPMVEYYKRGRINDPAFCHEEGHHAYTYEEARENILRTHHYGLWDYLPEDHYAPGR